MSGIFMYKSQRSETGFTCRVSRTRRKNLFETNNFMKDYNAAVFEPEGNQKFNKESLFFSALKLTLPKWFICREMILVVESYLH